MGNGGMDLSKLGGKAGQLIPKPKHTKTFLDKYGEGWWGEYEELWQKGAGNCVWGVLAPGLVEHIIEETVKRVVEEVKSR